LALFAKSGRRPPKYSRAAKHTVIACEMLDKRLVNYYAFCGWDKETGIPTKERFFCLVFEDIAKDVDRKKYKQRCLYCDCESKVFLN